MYELEKIGKVLTGPPCNGKRIYRAAVSQRLRNTELDNKNLGCRHPKTYAIITAWKVRRQSNFAQVGIE
jgi:hypothetical protein